MDIEEQAKISSKRLENILKETNVIIELIDKQIDDSETYNQQSTTDIQNIKKQINQGIDDVIDKLNMHKEQLFTSLDTIAQHKEKIMMAVRDGQEFNKAAATSLKTYTDNVLCHGRDLDRVQQVGAIELRLESVNSARTPSFVWNRQDSDVASSQSDITVADVTVKSDVTESQSVVGGLTEVLTDGSVINRDPILTKIPLIDQSMPVTGLVVMDQTVWVVHFNQSTAHAYPIASPHQPQALPIQGLANPYNMVRFPPGQSQLIVSDYGNERLLRIRVNQRNGEWRIVSQKSVKCNYPPQGLGVSDSQLLVCDSNVIHVLSTSGKETHCLNMCRLGVSPCKAVAQLTSPGFIIRDHNNKQVVLTTDNGEVEETYRGQRGFSPFDIISHGHSIYVSDCHNNRVDELNDAGRHVRQLISDRGVRQPNRLCVDETGHLYVTQGEQGKQEVWVLDTTATTSDTQTASPDVKLLLQQTSMDINVTWCT